MEGREVKTRSGYYVMFCVPTPVLSAIHHVSLGWPQGPSKCSWADLKCKSYKDEMSLFCLKVFSTGRLNSHCKEKNRNL